MPVDLQAEQERVTFLRTLVYKSLLSSVILSITAGGLVALAFSFGFLKVFLYLLTIQAKGIALGFFLFSFSLALFSLHKVFVLASARYFRALESYQAAQRRLNQIREN